SGAETLHLGPIEGLNGKQNSVALVGFELFGRQISSHHVTQRVRTSAGPGSLETPPDRMLTGTPPPTSQAQPVHEWRLAHPARSHPAGCGAAGNAGNRRGLAPALPGCEPISAEPVVKCSAPRSRRAAAKRD